MLLEENAMRHVHSIESSQHSYIFLSKKHDRNERKGRFVIVLTTAMMIAEIVGGTIFGSMALVADGWHMSTHAGALAISAFAYDYARRHKNDARFTVSGSKRGTDGCFLKFCSRV